MKYDDMHSDNLQARRKYLSDLARLKRIRAKQKAKNTPPDTGKHKRADIYKIDADAAKESLSEAGTYPAQKELDIAIARKDYKEYVREQNAKRELKLFPIQHSNKTDRKEKEYISVERPKIKSIKPKANKKAVRLKNAKNSKKRLSAMHKGHPASLSRPDKKKLRKAVAVPSKPKKSAKKIKKFFGTIFLLALLVGFSYFAYGFFYKQTGYYTIAIFGVDSRGGETGVGVLADVDIICNINKETKEVQLVSIYRDTYSMIDDSGRYHKLNEAYFLGGQKQAVATLERMLDIKIDDYITFNWKSVVDAINILGGVDVEITEPEFEYINSFITETVESTGIGSYQLAYPGEHHLDGVQAVAYARLRLMDTDFNRTERQRKIANLALEKAKKTDFATLKNLVLSVYPEVVSSISPDDLIPLLRGADEYHLTDSVGFPFDNSTKDIGKLNYVIPVTLESNVRKLHELLYKDTEYRPSRELIDISNTIVSKSGLGTKTKASENKATASEAN